MVRDSNGTVLASAAGRPVLGLSALVPAGRQSITVIGPRRLAFSVVATYVAP